MYQLILTDDEFKILQLCINCCQISNEFNEYQNLINDLQHSIHESIDHKNEREFKLKSLIYNDNNLP
jgi:hypothetical protein